MSDIKKMPEKIYVTDSEFAPGGLEVLAVNHDSGCEYIRADIAKGREAKLIQAAYYYPASLVAAESIKDAATLLHKKAKLEELK